ncbi:alpha-L-fucosidase [Knoellia remsis]|uniref:alpha-L-fucosidase n=2 Tax=Knoellia remsis TaxID=407159 RepID=A0A2T0UY89_9MICO|nr:alpha-L-fucosidase [Knoellia remsis]
MAMQPWFEQAKLGIFIHYGIYAVDGVAESWSFFNGEVSHEDYLAQLDGFTAASFDADAWAALFAASGARYAVLTAKHHDGVALYDTAQNALSTVRATPARRDIVAEYVDALRAHDLKVGIYFSHLDWTHPDYASVRPASMSDDERGNPFAVPAAGEEDPAAWERFLTFHRAQLTEILERFLPDLLWFDGDWERDPEQWRMDEVRDLIHAITPDAVINGRMSGGFGDYATPEQGVPIEPPHGPWELCLTMNDSWGHQGRDTNYKSVRQLVRIFAETIGGGGNLLLDVGPREDGSIPEEQVERLTALGDWIGRHDTAIHGTVRGLPPGHVYGPSTISADGTRLFLFCFDRPREFVVVRGLRTEVVGARLLGAQPRELRRERVGGLGDVPGWEYIHVPDDVELDPVCTVIELTLAGPPDIYREHTRD